ncbi:digalactosyldiacylglycerol synthase chloroplastic-like [Sesbania bispinosa]|nr:digalactosyldiacylglycerol synthase chloroplastic-like [Sesbania bispinosa]
MAISIDNLVTPSNFEIENFFNSAAPAFSVRDMSSPLWAAATIGFVKMFQPKLLDI